MPQVVDGSSPDTRLPIGIEVALDRIVQEALSNIRRHAAVRQVAIELDTVGDGVRLTIHDDGRGFDPSIARHRRLATMSA